MRPDLVEFMKKYEMPLDGLAEAAHRQILVVGADPSVSGYLANQFREADDFHVSTAPSALEAGYRIATAYPVCLIVDLAIGRLDTGQILNGVREIPVKIPTRIVLIATDEPLSLLAPLNPNEVVRKPVDPASLANLIRKLTA